MALRVHLHLRLPARTSRALRCHAERRAYGCAVADGWRQYTHVARPTTTQHVGRRVAGRGAPRSYLKRSAASAAPAGR
jgi:hypothetical protein